MHPTCLRALAILMLDVSVVSILWLEDWPGNTQARAAGFATVSKAECFNTAELTADERQRSEKLLLDLLDGEGLYTFVGGVKPVTSRNFFKVPFIKEYVTTKTITPAFVQAAEDMRRLVSNHDKRETQRALAYLWGYPSYAIDWFMNVHKFGSPFDNVEIPTFAKWKIPATGQMAEQYLWQVPKGHQENGDDQRIRTEVAAILAAYKERRSRFIGQDKPGAFGLLLDWYCDRQDRCSWQNATFAAQ